MRYRLGLAQALLGEPELLLLDEPTTGLDPAHICEIREAIAAAAASGATVVFSSHLLSEVERICTHAAVMRAGRLAPGTLTLAPDSYQPPAGTRSRGFVHHTNRERILDAVAQLNSIAGYTTLTAQSIAEHADISERAFLTHFKNKDDAFATAVEIGHMKGQAIIERARSDAPDWRTGVRDAVHALIEFLASEPYFTRLAFVDAPLAGPTIARRMHEHARAYERLLLDGAPQRRRPPHIAREATIHAAPRDTRGGLPHAGALPATPPGTIRHRD
jgi:energy-coupling factor transporter ATP-binding protein EcfA2